MFLFRITGLRVRIRDLLSTNQQCSRSIATIGQLEENCYTDWINRRTRWPWGMRRRYMAARLLRLRARIPLTAWMFVSCMCYVLYRYRPLWRADLSFRGDLSVLCVCVCVCVIVCDQETSKGKRPRLSWRHRRTYWITPWSSVLAKPRNSPHSLEHEG
jgi:hypothetical protein